MPAPDGPSSQRKPPSGTSKEIACSTAVLERPVPYSSPTASNRTMRIDAPAARRRSAIYWRRSERPDRGAGLFRPLLDLYHEGMRIVCPACAAVYEVHELHVPPGKVVRCARCATDWTPIPPEAAVLPTAEVEQVVAAPPEELPDEPPVLAAEQPIDEPPPPRRPGKALAAAWALSIVLLAAASWGAYARREEVVHAWPASERAYMALRIPVRL